MGSFQYNPATVLTYCTALATEENTLLAFDPISRIVPTTMTRITASITAYSAMSWPSSCVHSLLSVCMLNIPSRPGRKTASRVRLYCARAVPVSFNSNQCLRGKSGARPNRNGPAREIPAQR